ncbi:MULTISPECIES: M61 family metallopeptidase [unclassified Brevundimonas]|uniref:M61 family metallopeptidase n=1 Tax=unclassified Brevundimonas TaxID=2622653 RepID=UPI0025C4F356|nr:MULTISPECIES: peptidase M61 [unclassified Brevundimonas]
MSRRALAVCASAIALVIATPSLAQTGAAAPALPVTLAPIPAVSDAVRPGNIEVWVDATDLDRRVMNIRQRIPVESAGPLVLFYPQWIPGNHGPVGPISQIANLQFTANGQRVEWVRNTLHPWAYQIEVPQGVDTIDVSFSWLTPTEGAQGRVVMTPDMLNHQWEKAILYPAGYRSSHIGILPRLKLPEGFQYAGALENQGTIDGYLELEPINFEHLQDSPVFAGRHFAQYELSPNGPSSVRLNIVGDSADVVKVKDEHLALHRNLVTEADLLFGARHFDRYEFLVAVSDKLGGIGLEHQRSSENSVATKYFTDPTGTILDRDLLGHEYTHSWNGKWRRPADQMVNNFNEPLQNSLLWVYEGQTQYWGLILTARAGLMTKEEALGVIANNTAQYSTTPARAWRAMQDTTNDPIIQQRRPQGWPSLQRSEDYYREGSMVWLDADTLIREKTGGRKSLDDFARGFFGIEDGNWEAKPYTFEDVVAALNAVVPHDWTAFLRERVDAVGPDAPAPINGVQQGGYRLVYKDTPNAYMSQLNKELGRVDFVYSLGIQMNKSNRITSVTWGGLAFQQGLTAGWEVVAVNDRAASEDAIKEAITAAKDGGPTITLIVKRDDRFRTLTFDYRDGLRYPHLERIAGTPDRLGDILSPRRTARARR